MPVEDYVPRLAASLKQCRTMAQFRSVYQRADVGGVLDSRDTSTTTCLEINRLVARERDRVQAAEAGQ